MLPLGGLLVKVVVVGAVALAAGKVAGGIIKVLNETFELEE